YVIDIDPRSAWYHTVVKHIQNFPGALFGLRGLAVNAAGDALLVAAANRLSYTEKLLKPTKQVPNSRVYTFDLRPGHDWAPSGSFETGDFSYAVTATPDPNVMLVTNFLSDSSGVQVIKRTSAGWDVSASIPLVLGHRADGNQLADSFDVDNAREIVVTPDGN